jgi:hypothetical protein
MIKKIKKLVSTNLTNIPGFRTSRKIVVIESDDWGSIRMPNIDVLAKLRDKGFKVDNCKYMLNDCLESNDDLEYLFNFLEGRQKKPVITANFLTANPDFEKIKQADFQNYFNEPLEETLSRYPNHDNVKSLWLKGMANKYFVPQLHGREHLNVNVWMKDLQEGNEETNFAFNHNLFGVSTVATNVKRQSYQEAFGKNSGPYEVKQKILSEANEQFKELFGFNSKTFIAPNYSWDRDVEIILKELGILYIQGSNVQKKYNPILEKTEIHRHSLGEKNELNQKYLLRNVIFEPFSTKKAEWVSDSFKQIKNAFFWQKPAVISMHRVNFIGSLDPNNRKRNILLLNGLLNKIESEWPEVEYMSTEELSKLIK